ncbi:RHS repeat domain-containing protein [Brevibacillus sp. SYSU BS000544]|uniref:RHS repeat domain-containing protein n=1 Tax=Brevibacillus sp. SYSU BS000544 TaxID=3416443 RepID=UPI003CE4ED7C
MEEQEEDTSVKPVFSDDEILQMEWDQLPVKNVLKINQLYDRKTIQISSYFYTNLRRLLSKDEINETLNWNDEYVMEQIRQLPNNQFNHLTKYTPVISWMHKKWKDKKDKPNKPDKPGNKQQLDARTQSVQRSISEPTETKYTMKDMEYQYFKSKTLNPVDDLYRGANVVENDIELDGKHGMDFVLQRRYHTLDSFVNKPATSDEGSNFTWNAELPSDGGDHDFAIGWDFNIPSIVMSTATVDTYRSEGSPNITPYDTYHTSIDRARRYTFNLEDGTSLEWRDGKFDIPGKWVNYPYAGLEFEHDCNNCSAFLTLNGVKYEFTDGFGDPSYTQKVIKTNMYGDTITYEIPPSYEYTKPITITDSVKRVIKLIRDKDGIITDVKVFKDSSSTVPIKHIHYGLNYQSDDDLGEYYELASVEDHTQTPMILAQYEYNNPETTGYTRFNLNANYSLDWDGEGVPLDHNGYENQEYIDTTESHWDWDEHWLYNLQLKKVKYPVQGLDINYTYGTYSDLIDNHKIDFFDRGVVRLFKDRNALTFLQYYPVTSVTFSYIPKSNALNGQTIYSFTKSYEMKSQEIWKVPKSTIPRLENALNRDGGVVRSHENPEIGATVEKTFEVNQDRNHLLKLVKSTASKGLTMRANDGSKEYSYNPTTNISYLYTGNKTKPIAQYSFLEPTTELANIPVYQYLLNPNESMLSSVQGNLEKYANITTYEYDGNGDIKVEIDPLGNQTDYDYESGTKNTILYRQLKTKSKKSTDGLELSEVYEYNSDRLLYSETITYSKTADKSKKIYTYQDKLLTKIDTKIFGTSSGTKTLVTEYPSYDSYGLHPETMVLSDIEGVVTDSGAATDRLSFSYLYDDLGNLKEQTYPDQSKVSFSYDVLGRRTSEEFTPAKSTISRKTTYGYNADRSVTQTLPDGSKIDTFYTPFGDVEYSEQTSRDGQKRPLVYNSYGDDGLYVSSSYPYALEDRKVRYHYNSDGSPIYISRREGISSYFYANAALDSSSGEYIFEDVTKMIAPRGLKSEKYTNRYGLAYKDVSVTGDKVQKHIVEYKHNNFGFVDKKTESNGSESRDWVYTLNVNGQPTHINDPENNEYNYKYDSVGNLIEVTENGVVTSTYDYNVLSWKLSEVNQGSTKKHLYTYDETGNVKTYVDKNGSTYSYKYTPYYEVERVDIQNTAKPETFFEEYKYDDATRLLKKMNNGYGADISYQYDSFNRMNHLTAHGKEYKINYQENEGSINKSNINDLDDLMDSLVYEDDKTKINYTYDSAERLASVSSPWTGMFSYEYDLNSSGESREVSYPNNTTVQRNFNSFGEIIKTKHSDGWMEENQFDGFGNINQQKTNDTEKLFEYDKINRIKQESGQGLKKYDYDDLGNREVLQQKEDLTFENESFQYDLQNRLKSYTKADKTSTYTYNNDGLRASKKVDGKETKYVYLNGRIIEELDGNGNTIARNLWGNELLSRKDYVNNKTGYYYYNTHGDVVKIKSPTGEDLNTYEYDIWGNVIKQTEGMENPFKYSGEPLDSESNLYYLRARYYDPKVGRFITEDTYKGQVDNPLSLNLYTYAWNNPSRYTDPSGHAPDWIEDRIAWTKLNWILFNQYKLSIFRSDAYYTISSAFENYSDHIHNVGSKYNVPSWIISGIIVKEQITKSIPDFVAVVHTIGTQETHSTGLGAIFPETALDAWIAVNPAEAYQLGLDKMSYTEIEMKLYSDDAFNIETIDLILTMYARELYGEDVDASTLTEEQWKAVIGRYNAVDEGKAKNYSDKVIEYKDQVIELTD